MKNHHEVGHFKTRLMILSLSLVALTVTAGQSLAATTCSSCHGMPPLDDTKRNVATGAFVGSHQSHVNGGAVAADCVVCHSGSVTSYAMSHSATSQNKINMTPGIYSKGTFFNQTSMPALGTCSNASCHADVYSSSLTTSPTWGTTGNGCTSCHSVAIATTGPATGSHALHNITDCSKCHDGATNNTTKPTLNHADGNIDVIDGYPANVAKHAAGSYTGTCSTASCHANVYGSGSSITPVWGSTGNGCSACHSVAIDTTGPATGSHAAHAEADCSKCHTGASNSTTKPTADHIDGNIDVADGYPANVAKHAAGSYTGTCSTASCHANVYGTGSFPTPVWGSTGNGCSACHSVSIATTGPATGSHAIHAETDCSKCHAGASNNVTKPTLNHADGNIDVIDGYPTNVTKHAAGTYTGTCSTASCHANVYGSGSIPTPVWGSTGNGCSACHSVSIASTGPATGSHAIHNTTDCSKCHAGATDNVSKPTLNHANGNIDVTDGYPANVVKHAAGSYTGTCSTASCHANVYGSGTVATPVWGSTGNGCSACHTVAIATTGPATGSHAVHGNTDCSKCHTGATNNATMPTLNHNDGNIDVADGYPANVIKHAVGTYTGSCATASCHANVYGSGTVPSPVWGSTGNGCSACHTIAIGTNGPATGSHTAHAGKACDLCHAAGTTATTAPSAGNGHIDGNIDVYYFNYPADVAKHAAGSNYGTCSTAYCHSNGRGTYTSPTWGGTSTGCNFCHPNLGGKHSVHTNLATAVYGSTADNSAAGSYDFGCGNCHPTAAGNHMNGTVDLSMNSLDGGPLKSKNNVTDNTSGYTQTVGTSVTCAAAYCHSNGMATPTFYGASVNWYEASYSGDKCARCHGNSPNTGGKVGSSAHSAHTVGIHYTDIFNGVSKKLPQGGGDLVNAAHGRNNRSTTINCNICHALTVTSSANDANTVCVGCHDGYVAPTKGVAAIADKSKHVNGTVDVSFVAQKISTKAQVAKTAFAAYTSAATGGWTRNNNLYKTYTSAYDVTKTMLSASPAYTTAAGCAVACHSNIVVKWTDSVTCTNCHTRLR